MGVSSCHGRNDSKNVLHNYVGQVANLPKHRQRSDLPNMPPFSLLSYITYGWSRVLFAGASPAGPSRYRWQAFLLLLVLPGVLLYPCLSFHLFEPDEGRYAEIPREMLLRGEWVVPYLQGKPYLDKPPLFYWLVMGSYRIFGVHDWSARLVPALAVHGCVLLTYLLGRRSMGERSAFWGALALGLAPGFVSMGRLLLLDSLLALWVSVALFSAFEAVRGRRRHWGWWLVSALACGLGMLTKGPVALLLFWPPIWAYCRLHGPCAVRHVETMPPHVALNGLAGRIGWRAGLVHTALVLAVVLPWYGAICLRVPGFAVSFFWEHNVVRFLAPFDHERPIWFYGPILAAGFLPASLLAVPFLCFLCSSKAEAADRRSPELGFLLLSGGWCVLFFSLSGCKLPTYILPAFPPLALAAGVFVAGSRWQRSRWLAAGGAVVVGGLLATHYVVVPWYARFHSPLGRPEHVFHYCGNRATPVVCYPRNCDSAAFYLGRDDFHSYRSKETPALIRFLQDRPRTVILFTHRHSLEGLRQVLPKDLRLKDETPLSGSLRSLLKPEMCYMAVVERRLTR